MTLCVKGRVNRWVNRKKLIGSWYEIESLVKEGIDVQESPVLGFLIDEKGLVSVHRFRVQRSGLGTRTKLKTRSPRKKCWFCDIIAKYHIPDLWGCGSGRFSHTKRLQMTYVDENATFEPLNP